jgi:hypothetical protein
MIWFPRLLLFCSGTVHGLFNLVLQVIYIKEISCPISLSEVIPFTTSQQTLKRNRQIKAEGKRKKKRNNGM